MTHAATAETAATSASTQIAPFITLRPGTSLLLLPNSR